MVKENSIVVDINSSKKSIDPMIYSNFIEHLGDCIHNGLWAYDPVNVPLIEDNPRLSGVRQDVLKAAKELKIPVLRGFGGCYSDVYHWKDAIGPRETRKKVKNEAWGTGIKRLMPGMGPKIENQFGTDEFLTFCEEINTEPYLNINYGSGTLEEAADWVEYCNGSVNTKWGKLRAQNGREKPYNVKFWGIANEIFGWWETGHEKHAEDYAKKYLAFAKVMREKDPSIKLVACGCQKPGWNQMLLKIIGDKWVDYLSIHRYMPGLWTTFVRLKRPHKQKLYNALMASPIIFEEHINETWDDITSALGKDTHVRIAFDEWGVWYLAIDIIRTNFSLQDGVWTALILMVFQKMSDVCPMANWAQLINCIGAMQTRGDQFWLTPIYFTLKMFVDHTYTNLVEGIEVECETFDSKKYAHLPKATNTPYLACNATIDDKNDNLSILLINKHFSNSLKTNLEIKGFNPKENGNIIELFSDSPYDYNTKKDPEKIKIVEEPLTDVKSKITIDLKPHSITFIKLSKQ